jgi:creatinine amidohydrolase/Fe(II)-dependent formamide hydrolase-like protein
MERMELEQLTTSELEDAIAAGVTTVVLPIGSVAQHGSHLPLGTDAMLGDELGRRVADRLGAVLAPTVRIGCADHHMTFAGTLTLTRDTLRAVAVEIGLSLAKHGFRLIVLLPTQGGNIAATEAAVEDLNDTLEGAVAYSPVTDIGRDVLEYAIGSASRENGVEPSQSGAHAGEWETSVMLALRPELVRRDRAEAGYTGDMGLAVKQLHEEGVAIEQLSSNGVMGDPTLADADRGRGYVDRLAGVIASAVSVLRATDAVPA